METLGGFGSHGHMDGLETSLLMSFNHQINSHQQNGIPQESKLLTYLGGGRSMPHADETIVKSVASLGLDEPDKKYHIGGAGDFLSHRSSPASVSSALTHSSSTPAFPPFLTSSRNGVIDPSQGFGRHHQAGRMGTPSPATILSSSTSPPPNQQSSLTVTGGRSPPMSRRRSPVTTGSPATSTPLYQENVNGTTYFYMQPGGGTGQTSGMEEALVAVEAPGVVLPDYHVYPGQSAHVANLQPKASAPSFFMPDELKANLLHQSSLRLASADPEAYPDLVPEVDKYHDLCPLEPLPSSPHVHKSIVFGCMTSVYKATNSKTGEHYSMRRVHGFRLSSNMNMKTVQAWRDLQHSNVVQFREVFTTKVFGDNSLVLVYDYHPAAETMQIRHFSGANGSGSAAAGGGAAVNGVGSNPFVGGPDGSSLSRPFPGSQGSKGPGLRQHSGLLPESMIWNYVIQISSALRTIHAAGLAFRCLHPSKILITHKSRIRLNCAGMADLISPASSENSQAVHAFQQEDLAALGKLILALACNTLLALQSRESMQASMDIVGRNYSVDLRNLIAYLLFSGPRVKAVVDIMPMIGARFYTQLDSATLRADVIEAELAKEVENGRLFRLIAKICTIIDRAEFNMDVAWSETGDRYMLKLFRDYVFHQVTEDGQAWIDLSHVVYCLNKLEAGSREKVALMSRDEQNILVVSFAELRQCLEQSWREIESSAADPGSGAAGSLPRGGAARTDLANSVTASAAAGPGASSAGVETGEGAEDVGMMHQHHHAHLHGMGMGES